MKSRIISILVTVIVAIVTSVSIVQADSVDNTALGGGLVLVPNTSKLEAGVGYSAYIEFGTPIEFATATFRLSGGYYNTQGIMEDKDFSDYFFGWGEGSLSLHSRFSSTIDMYFGFGPGLYVIRCRNCFQESTGEPGRDPRPSGGLHTRFGIEKKITSRIGLYADAKIFLFKPYFVESSYISGMFLSIGIVGGFPTSP